MKKQLIMFLSMVIMLASLLAVCVFADGIVANTITSDTYGTIYQLNEDPGLTEGKNYVSTLKNIEDKGTEQDTLSILYYEPYYYVFPTSYIINEVLSGGEKGKFEYNSSFINKALADWDEADDTITLPQFEQTGSWSNTRINALIRIEFSKDVLYFDKNHCLLRSTGLKEAVMHDSIKPSTKSTGIFSGCEALETVRLSTQYTVIYSNMFNGCTNLEGISNWDDIKANVTSIGDYAFYKCSALDNMDLSQSVLTLVDNYAFYQCTSLSIVDLSSATFEKLGNYALRGCGATRIVLPATLTAIGQDAFNGCSNLEYLNVPRDCKSIGNYSLSGCSNLLQLDMSKAEKFESIGSNNSFGKITSLVFPEGFLSINGVNSTYITELVFPNSTTSIGVIKCENLEEFVVPAGITTMGGKFFDYCKKLNKVTIPKTVTSIVPGNSNDTFFGTYNVTNVIYTGTADTQVIKDVIAKFPNATITYANHCDVYYNQQHLVTNEPVKEFLGQKFLSNYKVHSKCERDCGVDTTIEELPALIVDRGFAYGPNSMLQGVAVDRELLDAYGKYFTGIKYGLVAAAKSAQTSASIINANGEGVNGYVAAVDYTERDYDLFEMNLFGISENYQATEFYFGAYVIAGGQVYYIHNGTTNNEAQAITYNDVVVIVDALIPENKEEEALA